MNLEKIKQIEDMNDDAVWLEVIKYAFDHIPNLENKLIKEFSASKNTILRWVSGKNAPHSKSRKVIYNFIIEEFENYEK